MTSSKNYIIKAINGLSIDMLIDNDTESIINSISSNMKREYIEIIKELLEDYYNGDNLLQLCKDFKKFNLGKCNTEKDALEVMNEILKILNDELDIYLLWMISAHGENITEAISDYLSNHILLK